jgi:hypothetical protein
MHDAILNKTLRLTIVGTIAILSLACLILAYLAIFEAIARHWPDAAARLVWSASAGLSSLLLITYRGELIDD